MRIRIERVERRRRRDRETREVDRLRTELSRALADLTEARHKVAELQATIDWQPRLERIEVQWSDGYRSNVDLRSYIGPGR